MHKQNNTFCCKNNCCRQENSQLKSFFGNKNYTKDPRKRTCVTGPSQGFVQNLKDKILNLQNESLPLQFAMKPVKKKQTDYYFLMLGKINSLDKKLQNLEHLFFSHLNHSPKEVFDNEPLYNHMEFYESVRSLIDFANRLKGDILYKQCDRHITNRKMMNLNDQIQVLDSELQNLYTYLDQLQNYTSEIKNAKLYFAEDHQDLPFNCRGFRGDNKVENKKCPDYKDFKKTNQNKNKPPKKCNKQGYNYQSSHCIDCCYETGSSPGSCHCSRCNLNATVFSMTPGNKRFSPTRFEQHQGRYVPYNSECSCGLCANERKNDFCFRKNNLWPSLSTSTCSCEICMSKNRYVNKPCSKNPRVKIVRPKPVHKSENEENFLSELQISYQNINSKRNFRKKKQRNKRRKLKTSEGDRESDSASSHDTAPQHERPNLMSAPNTKSRESIIKENTGEKSQHFRTDSASNKQETKVKNVEYTQLTPDLNIITKGKNNVRNLESDQVPHQGRNKDVNNNNKIYVVRDNNERNKVHHFLEEETSVFEKVFKNKNHTYNYSNYPSLNEQSSFYRAHSFEGMNPREPKIMKNTNGPSGKHLHIKIHKKKEFGKGITVRQTVKRTPERQHNYTNNHSNFYHRPHGGFCHFRNRRDENVISTNKIFSPFPLYSAGISEYESFESITENGSDSNSNASQYRVFFCDDPNCVENLDSDELIMLTNQKEFKYFEGNPYRVNASETTKDVKSDVCEKCKIKEKTILVTPNKTKNNKINNKAEIIFKRKVIECSNCKNKNSDPLLETNRETVGYNRNNLEGIRNKTLNIDKIGTHMASSNQEYFKNDVRSNSRNTNDNEIQNQKSNHLSTKKGSPSTTVNDQSTQMNNFGNSNKKTLIVASSNLEQNTSFTISKTNKAHPNKALELPGFGNLININIDKSYYSNQQPDIVNSQTTSGGAKDLGLLKQNLSNAENKNVITRLIADKDEKSDKKVDTAQSRAIPKEINHSFLLNMENVTDNVSRKMSTHLKMQSLSIENNKSISSLDLKEDSEKQIKELTLITSEIFTKPLVSSDYNTKQREDLKSHHKGLTVLYATKVNNEMVDGKDGIRLQAKKNQMNINKKIPLNYDLDKNYKRDSRYVNDRRYDASSKTRAALKKNIVKPRVSATGVYRSRLKFNKKFGSNLSKVSSAGSVEVHQAKFYAGENFSSKKSNVFNPGRRTSKLSKRRNNVFKKMCTLKQNSLSGITKSKLLAKENYQIDFQIASNDSCSSRYKVASISNYLSSTGLSESSFSTVNWEKVAKELKEEDKYFNKIAS